MMTDAERKLYMKRLHKKTDYAKTKHLQYKRELDRTIRKAKKDYYQGKLNKVSDSKETWKIIFETAKRKKK